MKKTNKINFENQLKKALKQGTENYNQSGKHKRSKSKKVGNK